jgi:hypothetical protein
MGMMDISQVDRMKGVSEMKVGPGYTIRQSKRLSFARAGLCFFSHATPLRGFGQLRRGVAFAMHGHIGEC